MSIREADVSSIDIDGAELRDFELPPNCLEFGKHNAGKTRQDGVDHDAINRYHESMNEKISDQIRRAILEGPMSRYRLATEARVDPGHLSRFVNQKASLSLDAVDRIGEVLGLRIVTKRRKDH